MAVGWFQIHFNILKLALLRLTIRTLTCRLLLHIHRGIGDEPAVLEEPGFVMLILPFGLLGALSHLLVLLLIFRLSRLRRRLRLRLRLGLGLGLRLGLGLGLGLPIGLALLLE